MLHELDVVQGHFMMFGRRGGTRELHYRRRNGKGFKARARFYGLHGTKPVGLYMTYLEQNTRKATACKMAGKTNDNVCVHIRHTPTVLRL